DLGQVVLAGEQRAEAVEVDPGADPQPRIGARHAVPDDEPARHHLVVRRRARLRLPAVERHRVRDRLLAVAEPGAQQARAAVVAADLALEVGVAGLVPELRLGAGIPAGRGDARPLAGQIGDHVELLELVVPAQLDRRAGAAIAPAARLQRRAPV